jgi:biopolymer transport protein ExbB
VWGYNWLLGRNKVLQDAVRNFAGDLHAYLVSGARVAVAPDVPGASRPATAAPAAAVRK